MSKRIYKYILIFIIVVVLGWINFDYINTKLNSNNEVINNYQKVGDMDKNRAPAVSGLFYSSKPTSLKSEVDGYLNAYTPKTTKPKILIVPHAGYMYSAKLAGAAYAQVKPFANSIKTVIILGPSHYVGINGAALSKAETFSTPLGKVRVNQEINAQLAQNPTFKYNDKAHKKEHSIEVQLPLMQSVFKKFEIVPIAYGDINPMVLAQMLEGYIKRDDVLLVVSADLSHYLPAELAEKVDAKTIDQIQKENPNVDSHSSCGATGINTAIILAKELNLNPKILDFANSGDVTGDKSSVVGYASVSYAEKKSDPDMILTPLEQEIVNLKDYAVKYGKDLFKVAQASLEDAVVNHHKYKPSRKDYANEMFDRGAAFVTLNKNNELRGCIGSIVPEQAIALDVAENTYNAAMNDSRFQPIKPEELKDISISISLLSGYERIYYKDEADLKAQLKSNIDGLVIRDGNRQGLFLPSVWEQIPNKDDFLTQLKLKAGMSPNYWSNKIKAYRFRVVEIKENED